MKRTFALFLMFTMLWTSPALASKEVVAAVKAQFEAQGVDLRGSCGAFYITNEVARRTGTKLLKKVPGQNRAIVVSDGTCRTPEQAPGENGYAVEYLITLPVGYGYDILGDSGGDNSPRWAEETNKVDRNLKNWADPITNLVIPGATPPTPTPGPTPPVFDEVAQRLTHIEATTNSLFVQAVEINAKLDDHIISTERFQAAVGNEYKKFGIFVAKYVLPLVGGILGGKYLFGGQE
jgi:hypothetical protein